MQKRITVERIFPLERFGNVHVKSELFLSEEELDGYDSETLYDDLVKEVYRAGLNHHELIKETKLVETVEEKRKILYGEN